MNSNPVTLKRIVPFPKLLSLAITMVRETVNLPYLLEITVPATRVMPVAAFPSMIIPTITNPINTRTINLIKQAVLLSH